MKFYVYALVGTLIKRLYKMHGATINIGNAQQAKLNNYKTTKLKLLKRPVNIRKLISECF